jgi:hypothetical protein
VKQSALKIVLLSLRDTWLDLWTVLVCNVVWVIANLLIIPGPPVTLALFYYTNQVVHEETVNVSDFFNAIPRFWSTGWRWGILNLAIMFFLIGDLILTSYQSQTQGSIFFSGIYITLIVFWTLLQVFSLPFLLEQKITSVLQALRNGIVMIGKNPFFCLLFLFLLIITLILGTVAFMLSVAFGGALVAFAGNRAVLNQLESQYS